MKHLDRDDFLKYVQENKVIYLANPHIGVVYRMQDCDDGQSTMIWCKRKGEHEVATIGDSEESFEAFLFREVLTKEEYDNY